MKHYYLSAFAVFALTSSAFACGADEDYLGSICTTAMEYCPVNTLEADGRLLSVNRYIELYSLLGTTYGGTWDISFNLPDLRGREAVGINDTTVKPGTKRGAESVTLTMAQMPQHTHAAAFTPGNGTNPITVTIPVSANTVGNQYAPDSTKSNMAGTTKVGNAGAAMWTSTMPNPSIPIKGVTVSGDTTSGSVAVASIGASTPVSVLPPQLGLKYCVVVRGYYPQRP